MKRGFMIKIIFTTLYVIYLKIKVSLPTSVTFVLKESVGSNVVLLQGNIIIR